MPFDLEGALATPPDAAGKKKPAGGFDLEAALNAPPPDIATPTSNTAQTAYKGFDLEAALSTPPPQVEAAEAKSGGFMGGLRDRVSENMGKGIEFWGNMFTPSGQEANLRNPETSGMAGAILGPLAVAGGGLAGDSPIAETEREN